MYFLLSHYTIPSKFSILIQIKNSEEQATKFKKKKKYYIVSTMAKNISLYQGDQNTLDSP